MTNKITHELLQLMSNCILYAAKQWNSLELPKEDCVKANGLNNSLTDCCDALPYFCQLLPDHYDVPVHSQSIN
jgi:hypothetical protein